MLKTNPKKLAQSLKKKGWKSHHIAKVKSILEKGEERKSFHLKSFEKKFPWYILIMLFILDILILTGILPVIATMPTWFIVCVISIIGLCFGLLIDNTIKEFHFSIKHYILTGIFLAILATATMFIVLELGDNLFGLLGLMIDSNPLLIIFFFITSFSLPHFFTKTKESA
jgi:cation transport ATPase